PLSAGTAARPSKAAEAGAVWMIERNFPACLLQALPELEGRLVGEQRAGDHDWLLCSLALHDHAAGSAHDIAGALAQNPPAGFRDFGYVGGSIHLREKYQLGRILRV